MTRSLRCLKLSTDSLFNPRHTSHASLTTQAAVLRSVRHVATATATRPTEANHERLHVGEHDRLSRYKRDVAPEALPYPRNSRRTADPAPMVAHLRELFPHLEFPPVLATRMLTHISAREAPWDGHNARLSFVGRRVLETYLNLFLHSVPPSKLPGSYQPDYVLIAYRALHTAFLGEHVGTAWNLNKAMLWTPAKGFEGIPRAEDRRKLPQGSLLSKGVGFFKVQGTVVEGIMGGIFHQFGGTVAHRIFHTQLLPHILCPGSPVGIPDHYHTAVQEIAQKLASASQASLVASQQALKPTAAPAESSSSLP